ncbi:hypothetical protein LWI28_021651 [Acer negundo]|uniref:Uncharacterized protein n=1 Tax=Acer negundo TaxID=4023 RepID=A0AAD5I7K9_ACENE|nr:hypothetical protein LWI28_021651 [Acer negundo]
MSRMNKELQSIKELMTRKPGPSYRVSQVTEEIEGEDGQFSQEEQAQAQALGEFQRQMNDPYSNTYNLRLRNHPNFSWSNNNYIGATNYQDDCKRGETIGRDWKFLLERSFMATAGMVMVIRSTNISFSYGGKIVNFMIDSPKERKECDLEEEEVIFKEIGELEKDNTKLKLEVYLLKAENGMLKMKVHNFSTLNKSLEEQVVELAKKEELVSKNLQVLARLSTEVEEDNGRRSRKMLLSVENSTKAVLELQEWLNKKEDELKRAKMSGRTRQSTKQGSQVSERLPRRGPQVPPQCVWHIEFVDRLEYFREHDIVVERGIALEELADTPIP